MVRGTHVGGEEAHRALEIGHGLCRFNQTLSPDSLNFIDSIFFLVAIVIGGLGTILGSVIGALFLTFQVEGISVLAAIIPGVGDLRNVIFGGFLIVVIILFPSGIAGFVRGHLAWSPGRILEQWRRVWALWRQ